MHSGGPDGELGASLRYLSQRYAMPYPAVQALLTDIGTEELGHLEMIAAIVHQLTRNLTDDQIQNNPGFASYFVDHTAGIYPTAASGFPWSAASIGVKGDPICDLTEDMAAEQKARVTYDNILRLAKEKGVTFLVASHLASEIEKMCDKVLVLHEGEMLSFDTKEEALRLHPSLEDYFLAKVRDKKGTVIL